ncbi:hypothetical protein D3C86_2261870 [compost metagenome]
MGKLADLIMRLDFQMLGFFKAAGGRLLRYAENIHETLNNAFEIEEEKDDDN